MKTHILSKNQNVSFKDASILRKFTIFFILMSLIPMSLLTYFYFQFKLHGQIQISEFNFNITLILVVAGTLVGYLAMVSILKKLINVANANRKVLEEIIGVEKIGDLQDEQNEIALLARSFSVVTTRLEENIKDLEETKKTLHNVMNKVGQGISNMRNIDTFLELILETATDALNGRVGVLMLIDKKQNELFIKSVYGINYDTKANQIKIKIDEGTMLSSIVKLRTPIIIPRQMTFLIGNKQFSSLFEPPLICAPLISNDQVVGVVTISGRANQNNFSEEEMNLLFNIASQTAVAVNNSKLTDDIESTYFETIAALALAVDAKDKYSRGHLERVAKYCVQIGKGLGLDNADLKVLHDAAKLHDLGKIGIPDEVLQKSAPLTEEEWELMRQHPVIGEEILKPIRSLQHLCDIIRHHHEKLDGSGYPDGLKGEEISALVRITTVADIYDALTTARPYRKQLSSQEAWQELRKMKNQLDQEIVEIFIESLQKMQPSQ